MKKIAVITHDSLNPLVGGGALRTLKVAQELKRRNYGVIMFVPSITSTIDGIAVFSLPAPRKVRSQVLSAIKFNFRLLKLLVKYAKNVNIFFVHNTIALPAILFYNFFTRKEIILDITDIHVEYLKIGNINFIEKLLRPIMMWCEYLMINKVKKVIVVTEAMKNQLIKKRCVSGSVYVVYDGADVERFSIEKDEDAIYNIIHLGAVDKQHGVHYLGLAAEYIISKVEKVHFYIIGDGRELFRVKKIVEDKKLINYFTFTGYQNHYEIQKYLKKCLIGVILRPDCLPNRLVVTLKLLEYWASGTAVVAPRLLGIQEITSENENIVFFEPSNYKDLANKLIKLLRDKDFTIRIALSGRKNVEKYNWNKLIDEIIGIIIN